MKAHTLICLAATFATGMAAAPITSLYNTGLDASGALLLGGNGTIDPHYNVISGPGSPTSARTFSVGAYFANGPSSRWISSTATGGSAGTYVFETTFDLTGFNPSLTSITVSCGTDNFLDAVAINGAGVTGNCDGFSGGFTGMFSITSGFVTGINSLQFSVRDVGAPMAFRAQYTSDTTELSTVPEPGAFFLMACGLMVVAVRMRKGAAG